MAVALAASFVSKSSWRPFICPLASASTRRKQPWELCRGDRGVSRVRINRFTGVRALKVNAPKTEWQLAAEKEFLAMRNQRPEKGYTWGLTEDDVRHLSPDMRHCLSLKCASTKEVSMFRKAELIQKFQLRPFDSHSKAVTIACLTEKILTLRAHLLRHPKHVGVKRSMSIRLSARHRIMRALYKSDYMLYKHVCSELGIRCIRFAVPDSKDPRERANPQAVDGDRAKWLIRQRLYRGRYRPREMREPESGRLIRYTRHPQEPVPESWGKPQATAQQVSRAWPYGVRQERVEGRQIVYNPTAPGNGYIPASGGRRVGGPTPEPE